jgi:hypothetical protein
MRVRCLDQGGAAISNQVSDSVPLNFVVFNHQQLSRLGFVHPAGGLEDFVDLNFVDRLGQKPQRPLAEDILRLFLGRNDENWNVASGQVGLEPVENLPAVHVG